MALPQLKNDATVARLNGLAMPEGAAWATAARQDALARVSKMGLPHKRDEYWRYTDPATLVSPDVIDAALFHNDEGPLFDAVDRVKVVFVDGVYDAEASDDLAAEGLEIETLADAMSTDIHWVKDLYGTLEINGQSPVERPLAALNTAFAANGVVIRATGKAVKPVNLIYLHKNVSSDAFIHNVIKVEAGAEMTLLETGPAAARFSKTLEVDVADGGAFHHVRAQGRDHERRAVTHCFARIATERIAHVAGACVGDGKDFHHDDTVFITHDAVNCESRQVFKKVLRNGATGVFQGKILVKKDAQKTDGYQISQSLLLDDDSQFLAKPELEIYADDVACSHGSTSGAIDETALFYLRSRGVPEKQAKDLLTLAFLAEALEEIDNDVLADDLQDRLESWLARHG